MTTPDRLVARLAALVGAPHVITDRERLAPFLREWRGNFHGAARLAVQPADAGEVARVAALCAETATPIVPQGGNTGLVGGAVAGADAIILSLSRLDRVRAVDAEAFTLTAEAGCTLAAIQRAAAQRDRLFPLSLASEGSCQLGGVLSTNAGGVAVLRYGTARELTLGLEVVLADGRTLDLMRGLRKDNTGYDLKSLFLGSEGTLGIVTAAVVKLFPAPRAVATAFVALTGLAAAAPLLAATRRLSGDQVASFELMNRTGLDMVLRHSAGATDPLSQPAPWSALIELTSPDDAANLAGRLEAALAEGLESGLVRDATIAQNAAQRARLWRLREDMSDAQRHEGGSIKHDVSAPLSAVALFIERASTAVTARVPGARIVAFGHVGDGNIHFNVSQPLGADCAAFLARWGEVSRIVHDIADDLGGAFSAEHGVGRLKTAELERYQPAAALDLMRRLKRALDPQGLLNPGAVLRAED